MLYQESSTFKNKEKEGNAIMASGKKSSTECIAPPKDGKVINWLFLKEAIFMEEFRQVSPKKTNKTQKTQTAR